VISILLVHLATHQSASAAASHIRLSGTPSPSQTSQPATSSSGDISALESAIIGIIAAILGGIVGGGFTMWAGIRESRSEREATRLDRSKQAAMDIAAAWPVLEEALLNRAHGKISADDFHKAFNTFSRTATMQSIPIVDEGLRRRVRGHRELAFSSTLYADDPGQLTAKVERLRTNGGAISDSIDAHYHDKPLPDYSGPLWPKSPSPHVP
jgi:hypothetical protein